jgi:hypothetical protein
MYDVLKSAIKHSFLADAAPDPTYHSTRE